jgi:hypothetical protein
MAITATDILFKFSVAAAAGDTTAGTAAGSLGDQISTTAITDATLHNLFDVVTGDENAASEAEYRGIFVHNNHATLTWENVVVWLSAETAGGAVAAIREHRSRLADVHRPDHQGHRPVHRQHPCRVGRWHLDPAHRGQHRGGGQRWRDDPLRG